MPSPSLCPRYCSIPVSCMSLLCLVIKNGFTCACGLMQSQDDCLIHLCIFVGITSLLSMCVCMQEWALSVCVYGSCPSALSTIYRGLPRSEIFATRKTFVCKHVLQQCFCCCIQYHQCQYSNNISSLGFLISMPVISYKYMGEL